MTKLVVSVGFRWFRLQENIHEGRHGVTGALPVSPRRTEIGDVGYDVKAARPFDVENEKDDCLDTFGAELHVTGDKCPFTQ